MKKLLLSASLIALSIGAAFSQTNAISAGNIITRDRSGYIFNFNSTVLENCVTEPAGTQYSATQFAPLTVSGGSLIINVPKQTSYDSNPDVLAFYTGNCKYYNPAQDPTTTVSSLNLSLPANQKFTISLNSSPASTSTTTSRNLVVVFYQGSNSTYNNSALIYTITAGSNIITSNSQGQKFYFGSASNVDSTQISAIGLLIRGTKAYNDFDAAGTYSIDYITVGDTTINGGGTSTNTTTGITSQEIALANQVSIFPNPATDNITVDLSLFPGGADVKILNTSGATVAEQSAQGSATFPVGNLTKGLYFIQISSDNLVVQKKFIHD